MVSRASAIEDERKSCCQTSERCELRPQEKTVDAPKINEHSKDRTSPKLKPRDELRGELQDELQDEPQSDEDDELFEGEQDRVQSDSKSKHSRSK